MGATVPGNSVASGGWCNCNVWLPVGGGGQPRPKVLGWELRNCGVDARCHYRQGQMQIAVWCSLGELESQVKIK